MKGFQVRVGGLYVSEQKSLVREVTHVDGDGIAHWKSYDLKTGESTGDFSQCSLGRIVQWAEREATPDEAARLERSEFNARDLLRVLEWVDGVLRRVSDEELFAEVKRRGRKVI
jgi:hypothetical protein